MDVIFNSRQQPLLPFGQVIEALERLRDNPQQLAHSRDRLNDEPPPPYSQSGETTELPTPEPPPALDQMGRRRLRLLAHYKSMPRSQFKSQAQRERERLEHQLSEARFGRRQTLQWDNSLDFRANPENNVRSRWVEQGIWGDDWGPAWPKNSHPLTAHEGGGPFCTRWTLEYRPGARWGHEEPDPEPEPELESESEGPGMGLFGPTPKRPKSPAPRPIGYTQTAHGQVPRYPIQIPTVRNPEASRPYQQFMYQVSKEREWIKDEMDHTAPGQAIDLDALAYESVKNNWIKDGIWHPDWDDFPGRTWKHEEPEPESEPESEDEEDVGEASHRSSSPSSSRPGDTTRDGQPILTRYSNLFGAQSPIHEVANDGAEGESTRGSRDLEANLPALEHGNTVSPFHRSKRTRRGSDTAADEQPRKRPRGNTQHSGNDDTKGAFTIEGAVNMTKRATRGRTVRDAVPIPVRRSSRIAAKQAAQAAPKLPAEPETKRKQLKSAETKTAKKGRPKRVGHGPGAQKDAPVLKKNAKAKAKGR